MSLSIILAQISQSQIPLSIDFRSSLDMFSSYLGPPGDAALIYAATPIDKLLLGSLRGPIVCFLQFGFEHIYHTL